MNILVTGAKGFVGRNLVAALKNIRDGKDRTRGDLIIGDIYEYDIDSSLAELDEACAHAIDLGNFYRVPCDKRGLNYDKYFNKGDTERNTLTEFNSSNTKLLNIEQVKQKLLTLQYIREELAKSGK